MGSIEHYFKRMVDYRLKGFQYLKIFFEKLLRITKLKLWPYAFILQLDRSSAVQDALNFPF